MLADLSTPQAPDPGPEEIWSGTPNVALDGERFAIGWQHFPGKRGGPSYVTARRSVLGGRKVLARYPLTADGWTRAWADLTRLDPATAEKTRVALARRSAELARRGAAQFALAGLTLRAVDPPAAGFAVGQVYDIRYHEDGLTIARSGSPETTAEYRYADVAAVQVTGCEAVPLSMGEVIFSPKWILMDNREYRIRLRVQTQDRTLDFSRASFSAATDFGRWLEPVNRAIRQAWLSAAADKAARQTEWIVAELSGLAERLDHGTVTRSDVELLKSRISSGG
jgi:hypothetical protein